MHLKVDRAGKTWDWRFFNCDDDSLQKAAELLTQLSDLNIDNLLSIRIMDAFQHLHKIAGCFSQVAGYEVMDIPTPKHMNAITFDPDAELFGDYDAPFPKRVLDVSSSLEQPATKKRCLPSELHGHVHACAYMLTSNINHVK
jgi:hypothetical protein